VFTLRFSPYFDGNLTTCGTGHIRFWKMASTFTGRCTPARPRAWACTAANCIKMV